MSSSVSIPVNGERVALDTSIAIDVLADEADNLLSTDVSEYLLPVPVVGELRYGALNSRKAEENLAKVENLVARCRILNVTVATAAVYARLRLELRQKGSPSPRTIYGLQHSAWSIKCRWRLPMPTSIRLRA